MTRAIPPQGVTFISEWEGLRLTAYKDQKGVWTIGYGHTRGVYEGMVITAAKARAFLRADLLNAASDIETILGADRVAKLTDEQYSVLLSFVFNLGPQPKATLWKVIKANHLDAVPSELVRWVYVEDEKTGKKVKSAGLKNRRDAESVLWAKHDPSYKTDLAPVPSSVTVAAVTTPVPAAKPPITSKSFMASAGAAVLAAPPMVDASMKAIGPFAAHSTYAEKMLGFLATGGAVVAVLALIFMWLKNHQARTQ